MINKIWLTSLAFVFTATASAAVPPGMQDTELKDTLVYLAGERGSVWTTNTALLESDILAVGGGSALVFSMLSAIPTLRSEILKSTPGFRSLYWSKVGAGLLALGLGVRTLARLGRANFDRDWIIERQHFRDLKAYFDSNLEVQYVIASDNSELREYLMELAAWIKASQANEETVTPSLKYQHLVPPAQN